MRHQSSGITLGGLAAAMLVAALATRQLAFLVAACMVGGLLGLSVAGMRQALPRALTALLGRRVFVALWGAATPDRTAVVVESVNVLGAGVHVFFRGQGSSAFHLKIAQPGDVRIDREQIVVGGARYVQWQGQRAARAAGVAAVCITAEGERESVA